MKNLHFCTKLLLAKIRKPKPNVIITYRTGWIPSIYPGDTIRLNERTDNGDQFLSEGYVMAVKPVLFKNIRKNPIHQEEIRRYNKKFHPDQWFFSIHIHLEDDNTPLFRLEVRKHD